MNEANSIPAILRAADAELVQIVETAMQQAVERAGTHLACYRGCAICCFAPFPITRLDAQRLQRGLAALNVADPVSASAIRIRANAAVHEMQTDFPGDAKDGTLSEGFEEFEFATGHADLACPALDPQSGACLLYEHRPIACRTYGPPLRLNGEDLPPCPLCFKHASADEIESARVELETHTLEVRCDLPEGRTLVAYALR